MAPFETIEIDEMVAACNGDGGPLGHPKVYLSLALSGQVECPYCSRLYVNRAMRQAREGAAAAGVTTPAAAGQAHDRQEADRQEAR